MSTLDVGHDGLFELIRANFRIAKEDVKERPQSISMMQKSDADLGTLMPWREGGDRLTTLVGIGRVIIYGLFQ